MIIEDESALPKDWSREEVKEALSNGFIASLDQLEGPVTRGQYAVLMDNLYFSLYEEGAPHPEYEEGVVTDCGEEDYPQFLMAYLGIMPAENGKFYPADFLTQEEALRIMHQVAAIASPSVVEETKNMEELVELYFTNDIIAKQGNNIYEKDKNLRVKEALVRCNRLYNSVLQ